MANLHPILSSLRNASLAKKSFTHVPLSKVGIKFLNILYSEGFIGGFQIVHNERKVRVELVYLNKGDLALVSSLKLVSRPGFKKYLKYQDLIRFYSGSFIILSTDIGIITGTNALINRKGGEFLCMRYYF